MPIYRHWNRGNFPLWYLLLATFIGLLGIVLVESTKTQRAYRARDQQIRAAQLMKICLERLRDERTSLEIPINHDLDPNDTGIIGDEFTDLTTSLGNLEAKRTATNPAFAALLVKYFSEAGLQRGDVVAIGASGSFPSLILATLCAANVMELRPLMIYSFGASMYGANLPEFTFVEMLKSLKRRGLLAYAPIAVSFGGDNDRAEGLMNENAQPIFLRLAESSGIPLIYEATFADDVREKMRRYENAARGLSIRCFVNIGGATANIGTTPAAFDFPNGLSKFASTSANESERGLLLKYAARGIPAIHLLNIKDLAVKNGLPIDPVPFPPIGDGGVYYATTYNTPLILLILCLEAFLFLRRWK